MSKILEIITNPNPTLRKTSLKIKLTDLKTGKYKALFDDMAATMLKKDGVGLAAPQIAESIRIVVINYHDDVFIMINPEITKKSWAKKYGEEGCLSVPKTFGSVARHKSINLIYLDKHGNKQKLVAKNMFARIIQHEIDHLDGVLFIDKAEDIKTEG